MDDKDAIYAASCLETTASILFAATVDLIEKAVINAGGLSNYVQAHNDAEIQFKVKVGVVLCVCVCESCLDGFPPLYT